MPQSLSAKKSLRQSEKRRALNNRYKNKIKTLIKELRILIGAGKKEEAQKLLPEVYKALDKGAKRGVIKKGNASRRKARLSIAINKITNSRPKDAKTLKKTRAGKGTKK